MNKIVLYTASLISLSFISTACAPIKHTNTISNEDILFKDVSKAVGLITQDSWKYGGPSVSDINNDGHYDFLLTNHDNTPVQLFMANGDNTYQEQTSLYIKADLHGIAAGDYDLDGDNDILLSLGGGNGTSPQPQRLLRNDNGQFTDITVESGISKMGARGRSVRWVDLDADGDLDFMQVNAAKMIQEDVPRNILFENLGNGIFTYRKSPIFEETDIERLLLTDVNNDSLLDIVGFSGYNGESTYLLQGLGDFTFQDITEEWLPKDPDGYQKTITAAHADIDNDGDLDIYLARGTLLYNLANNAVSFNKEAGRLDLRDEGNKSHDGITFYADENIQLSDFYHFPRARRMKVMPVFLGEKKHPFTTPATDALVTIHQDQALGFPEKIETTGWYLGYLGNGEWRMEWMLSNHLAWDIRASIHGVTNYTPDWTPQDPGISDVLLRNDGDHFTDISSLLPKEAHMNNWGVSTGDFDNNGYNDFFVYHFGELKQRVSDTIFMNHNGTHFNSIAATSATSEIGNDSHGDMGTAFDYNLDGKIDLLNGDDDNGQWHLYENQSNNVGNYILINVGYSEKGTDPLGATLVVNTQKQKQFKLIGSTSASHSQSVLNIAHFGLGKHEDIKSITVRWKDGSEKTLTNIKANQLIKIGK